MLTEFLGSKVATEMCVFDEQKSKLQGSKRWVEIEARTMWIHKYYMKAKK